MKLKLCWEIRDHLPYNEFLAENESRIQAVLSDVKRCRFDFRLVGPGFKQGDLVVFRLNEKLGS